MLQILLGSLLLSIVHASIPSHWLPLVAIGKAQGWSRSETLSITAVTGSAHVASTVLIGVLVGFLGYSLSADSLFTTLLPAALLVGLGIVYLILDRRGGHAHRHAENADLGNRASTFSIVASLAAAMFFSPCLEIEAYYLKGGALGWTGIAAISTVYMVVTVLGMMLLVDLGLSGARKIRSRYLENHEKQVTGIVLIALGLFAFLGAA